MTIATSKIPGLLDGTNTIGQQDDSLVPVPTVFGYGTVLTVGAGEEFSTIAAAVAAARDGDTIEVNAGIYTNDFATITAKITLIGVGGMVDMVATVPPANLKGILTVDNSVTIENFAFSGAAVPDADGGNGAGIRYEGGDMVLQNDSFTNNQDGLLAFPVLGRPSNTIVLDHDTFNENGSGTGYTHNAYIGAVSSLTVTNSIFEQAIVGHELKSRALVNTITNNLFYDGPTGTASYDIDLPNGGVDTVTNNTIEKGPLAPNDAMVHFGGEGVPYAGSSLTVEGNTFVGDNPYAIGVLNQTAISVTIAGNAFDAIAANRIASGPAAESGNVDANGTPFANTTLLGVIPGSTLIYTDALAHTVVLDGSAVQAVEGGAGRLKVTATAGHVVAIGGSGGMNYSEVATSGGNSITTAANSVNTIVLSGQDTLDSEGTDTITAGAGNITALINGSAVISDSVGSNQWSVNGTAAITAVNSNEFIALGAHASVGITGTELYMQITGNGGNATFDVMQGGARQQATITGGAVSVRVYNSQMQIVTSGGAQGATLSFAAGTVNLTSAGNDVIYAGASNATVIVSGAAVIHAGTGQLSVFGRSDSAGASVYAAGGDIALNGDSGNITYYGGATANTVESILSSDFFAGGAGHMTINGGSRETISGGAGGVTFNSNGGGANVLTTMASSTNVLNLSGQDVINSHGRDTISTIGTLTGTISGKSTVNGGSGDQSLTFSGNDTFTGLGHDMLTATAGAAVAVTVSGFSTMNETGATISYTEQTAAGSLLASVSVVGGSASIHSDGNGLQVTTNAGTATAVTMGAGPMSVTSYSNDVITGGSGGGTVYTRADGVVVFGSSGAMTVTDQDLSSNDNITLVGGSGSMSIIGAGSSISFIGGSGATTITGQGSALLIHGGAGQLTVTENTGGSFQFFGGSGNATLNINANGGTLQFGSGTTTVNEAGRGVKVSYNFYTGMAASTDIISNFQIGLDKIFLHGLAIASEKTLAGSSYITLADSSHITLTGVTDLSRVFHV
jgi:hypothetical protein